jgi:hypothetical protein
MRRLYEENGGNPQITDCHIYFLTRRPLVDAAGLIAKRVRKTALTGPIQEPQVR